jgi:hypothetical protein
MYPDNQDIEVFGEEESWPGVDANGKFTNGSFSDPMVKPSFIPAETINLILDNMESVIRRFGGTPNATSPTQLADVLSNAISGGIVITPPGGGSDGSDGSGEPGGESGGEPSGEGSGEPNEPEPGSDFIDRPLGDEPQDLMTLFGVTTIPEVMQKLRRRLNNNSEIDNTGEPNFQGLMEGDYIDGLDLNGIPGLANGGIALQAWNDSYKNNRIAIAGFNTYHGVGDIVNTKNHIILTFENIISEGRFSYQILGGTPVYYTNAPSSPMRYWLEGINGDGTGLLSYALKIAFGGDYLCPIRKKFGYDSYYFTVWLPSEVEVLGAKNRGDEYPSETNKQLPYFIDINRRKKTYNGVYGKYWLLNKGTNSSTSNVVCAISAAGSYIYSSPQSDDILGISPLISFA